MSSTTTTTQSSPSIEIVRDIILWRKKKLSLSVLVAATATWVAMEIYQFKFLQVVSWVSMVIVTLIFLWRNMVRFICNERPTLSGLEVSEQSIMEMANTFRLWVEQGIRWLFHVGAESDWVQFTKTVAILLVLSYVGSLADLLTLLHICVVMGLTVPVIYVKYEDKIKEIGQRLKERGRRCGEMANEKAFRKMKSKVSVDVEEEKEKKVE